MMDYPEVELSSLQGKQNPAYEAVGAFLVEVRGSEFRVK